MGTKLNKNIILITIVILTVGSCKKSPTDDSSNNNSIDYNITYAARKWTNIRGGTADCIALTDYSGKNHKELFFVYADDGYIKDPSFSYDGTKIIFVMRFDSLNKAQNIFTLNIDGSNLQKLTTSDTTVTYYNPQFLRNGNDVVFLVRNLDEKTQIKSLNILTKEESVLAEDTRSWLSPVYCTNGDNIYYLHIDGNIYKVSKEGNNNIKTTDLSYTAQIQTTNDKTKIYFVSIPSYGVYDLYGMDLDGGNMKRLTNRNDMGVNGNYMRISPDGKKILNLLPPNDSGFGIWIMNSDGSDKILITIFYTWEVNPDFYPDGKRIITQRQTNDGGAALYSFNIDGTDLITISSSEYYYATTPKFKSIH